MTSDPPIPRLKLQISTGLALHPDFVRAPLQFAATRGVALVEEPLPGITYSRDRISGERILRTTLNIHLVRYGAIRLFAATKEGESLPQIKTIQIDPSMLLYADPDHPLNRYDLQLALSELRREIAPILAKPENKRHIVPGIADDDKQCAYWQSISCEVTLPTLHIPDLYHVSHPIAGHPEGATPDRIQLGKKKDDLIISLEAFSRKAEKLKKRRELVRANMFLKGARLVARYGRDGMTARIGDYERLVRLRFSDFAAVHRYEMSHLQGTHLPPPVESQEIGRTGTSAKIVALLAQITPLSVEKLLEMDDQIRRPHEDTRKNLRERVRHELSRLHPVPITSLFTPELYDSMPTGSRSDVGVVDPEIAAAYW